MDLTVEPNAVIVVAGIPGAGKTTLIDRAVDPDGTFVVDIERQRRRGGVSRRRVLRNAAHYRRVAAAVLLRRGAVVIFHTRGTAAVGRRGLVLGARLCRRPAHLVLLVAPGSEAVAGQHSRGRTIPEDEMDAHVEKFAELVAEQASLEREGWTTVHVLDRAGASAIGRIGGPLPDLAAPALAGDPA